MGVEFREFTIFTNNFELLTMDYSGFLMNFLRDAALEVYNETKELTPVHYGALQNAWEITEVIRIGDELQITIFNEKEYASFVEDGHYNDARWVPGVWVGDKFEYIPYSEARGSGMMLTDRWVNGFFMAKIPLNKLERDMPARFGRAFQQLIKSLGVG